MTENLTRACAFLDCGKSFAPVKRYQRFCSASCRGKHHYAPRKKETEERRQERRNARFRDRNRDRSLCFDGHYGGPACSAYHDTRASAEAKSST
jgi:hypothetical protein